MFASRTPEWGQRRKPAGGAVRTARHLLARAVLVVATLMLFTFVTVETSQACSIGNNPTTRVAQIAQGLPQVIAKQHVIANRSAVASSVVKFAIKGTACCGQGSGHCHGLACAGSCCAACSSGLNVVGWTVARVPTAHFVIAPLHTPLSSPELDPQFRPPREVL
jgi:hypothetical protein